MLADVTAGVLHGGASGGGVVSFEAVLGWVVALLVLVGTLWYLGAFESMGTPGASEDGGPPDAGGEDAGGEAGASD